jgi:hypothetical protein
MNANFEANEAAIYALLRAASKKSRQRGFDLQPRVCAQRLPWET